MTRCPWCGARNYAIDMWCKRCAHYLDWAPPGSRRRRVVGVLSATAALVGVSLFLALPVAAWFGGSRPTVLLTIPRLTLLPTPQASPQGGAMYYGPLLQPSPGAEGNRLTSMPTPDTGPPPITEAAPAVAASPRSSLPGIADPSDAVNLFYRAVSAHHFDLAASMWTKQLRELDPPSVFIDQRFSGTDRVDIGSERVLSSGNGIAVIYVDVIEVVGGLNRHWIGTWQVVNTAAGWLLNQPDLQPGT